MFSERGVVHVAQDDLRTLVIGCGRRNAGDDGVGLQVIAELQNVPHLGCEFRALEGDCPPGFLAGIPADALVILIDSIRTNSGPGTIHCLKLPSKTARPRHLDSEETRALSTELERLKQRNEAAPRLFLLGVEIAEQTGAALGDQARKSVDEIVRNFSRYRKLAQDLT